jgi:hypothetical protein
MPHDCYNTPMSDHIFIKRLNKTAVQTHDFISVNAGARLLWKVSLIIKPAVNKEELTTPYLPTLSCYG